MAAAPGVALHGIAIEQILDFVFPRHESRILKSSNAEPLESGWLRALRSKKAVTLVCKDWHIVALKFLYRDISIRYVWQLVLLLRTIRSAPETFGRLIRSLTIICYVPKHLTQVASDCLNAILALCPLIRELSLEEAFLGCAIFPRPRTNATGTDRVHSNTSSPSQSSQPVIDTAALQCCRSS